MAGELWRGTVQMGVENPVAYGTPVVATRIGYFTDPTFTRTREPRLHRFAVGTRDNLRNITLGPTVVGGTLVQPLSAEVIELLLMGIKGAVTGVGGGATKTWTFTPDPVLDSATIEWHDGAALCVVMASGGYPGKYEKGKPISGLEKVEGMKDVMVFHAGTRAEEGQVVTNGGRVLGVTARGSTIIEAQKRAYEAVELIHFEGAHCRRDIGWRAIARQQAQQTNG